MNRSAAALAFALGLAALLVGGSSAAVKPPPTHLLVYAPKTFVAGKAASFKAYTADADVKLKPVGNVATFSISPDGSCVKAKCLTTVAGDHTVMASYEDPVYGTLTGQVGALVTADKKAASLGVTATNPTIEGPLPAPPTNMDISDSAPYPATSGFVVHGVDKYGNDIGTDLSSQATFSVTAGASCEGSQCGNAETLGASYTVTATVKKLQGSTNLTSANNSLAYTCQGEHYDVDNNTVNGCEETQLLTTHTQGGNPTNIGEIDCFDNTTSMLNQHLYSDSRAHQNPFVSGFNSAVGSSANWYVGTATGGACVNDYSVTFTTTGGGGTSCYRLTIITNLVNSSNTITLTGSGTNTISGGDGSYGTSTLIYFKVEKICNLPTQEAVGYSFSFHL
jgi:hypothetical protein